MDKFEQLMKYNKLLESVERIESFLEECHCSSVVCWDDNNETVMDTDIGYFFEGLDDLKQYLIGKGAT